LQCGQTQPVEAAAYPPSAMGDGVIAAQCTRRRKSSVAMSIVFCTISICACRNTS
jgi:hypothetical protein